MKLEISRSLPSGRLSWAGIGAFGGLLFLPLAAEAHVKWFAPYIIGAPPQPIGVTLTNAWFWTGIALVLAFFLATRVVETSKAGEAVLDGLDRLTDPLWQRLDDFVRVVIAAFFVAIFADGGVYLTPDLKTPAEWVSWTQLLIAGLIFSRKTQPFAAAGIVFLWLPALRDYDIFHLLDYLALGLGVAGYLVLEASAAPERRKHRFEVLHWGVAIALIWSSLEKFAYPDWFFPLSRKSRSSPSACRAMCSSRWQVSPSSRWALACFGRRWCAGFRPLRCSSFSMPQSIRSVAST